MNFLMEVFGNVKIVINDNFSRFGKYFEMFFINNGMVVGGMVYFFVSILINFML